MLKSDVWKRSGQDTMSKRLFTFFVAFWTLVGIGGSAAIAYLSQGIQVTWLLFFAVLVAGIAGVVISNRSSNPVISLFGYALLAIPFGMLFGPIVAQYTQASLVRVFFVTTGMVSALGVFGIIIPDNLEGWGSWLLGGLTMLLFGLLIVPIAGFFGIPIDHALTLLDWVGVILFSGYVIYDWNRAMRVPYTMDNSIDCAVGIYLDFVNLFLRYLRLSGNKKSSD